MSDILCNYQDREAALMSYLYDEILPSDREAFEAHLTTCARCRVELNGLGSVRDQLAHWTPPSRESHVVSLESPVASRQSVASREPSIAGLATLRTASDEPRAPSRERRAGWRDIPAWAQAAAALLVLGVSAGAANLNIHYDAQNGLNIHTGWTDRGSQGSQGSRGSQGSLGSQGSQGSLSADVVSRAELTALERQLRGEIQTMAAASVPARVSAPSNDADVVRRVKGLLDESERRHERELALRVAEVMRDINAQRQADLVKIDQNLNQGRVEVLRNRQMLDYYMQRASRPQ